MKRGENLRGTGPKLRRARLKGAQKGGEATATKAKEAKHTLDRIIPELLDLAKEKVEHEGLEPSQRNLAKSAKSLLVKLRNNGAHHLGEILPPGCDSLEDLKLETLRKWLFPPAKR